ncbi:hypothetical protein DEO72_LG4g1573 [Vigna unguiculata]|uniref:Secreted protein n=1 Tax=Vigna unguiculata TaxID=3917 RepID=A0A4D6LR93_VIGUN|nr:hypothetical protein DEO72_LG4g1573 [Vigna unguiculata]
MFGLAIVLLTCELGSRAAVLLSSVPKDLYEPISSEPVSPRRDKQGFAQTSLREGSPRRPARIFERADISPRREGSRLSEIPHWFLDALSSPRLGEGGFA